MVTFTGFLAENSLEFDYLRWIRGGTFSNQTASSLTITNGEGVITNVRGAGFTYAGTPYPTGGVTTGSDTIINGSVAYRIDGLSVTPEQTLQYSNQDPAAVRELLFSGDDFVNGSTFNDFILTYNGNDRVVGGLGNDTAFGNAGNDLIYGNQGQDIIYGNLGSDTLFGGQDADTVFGGQDNDVVYGNFGDDVVYGNFGSDLLYGGQGADTLYGGQGSDTLVGNIGDDVLIGGLGADLYVFGANSGRDLIRGFNQADGDRISLGGQSYTVSAAQNGDAVLTLSGGGVVDLAGIRADQVSASYFAA